MDDKSNVPGPKVSDIDKEIFELHNTYRKKPTALVPDLENMAKSFDGVLLKRQGKVTLKTKEGVDAVNEAIEFLKSLTPIQPLRWNEEISLASQDHARDIGPKGLIQHDSSDGKTNVKDRLRKYGNVISCYGENLSFHCDDAKEVMI